MKRFFLSAIGLFIFSFGMAQVPGTLSYQGILVKNDGTPVTDGSHSVTFNFYKVASGGIPIFTRGPITVTTYKGMFTLLLGTGSPAAVNDPLPVSATDANYIGNVQYYIELVADAVILSPRVQLSSVPYALTAQNANAMDAANLTGTANLPITVLDADLQDLADGSLTGSKVGTGILATNITSGALAVANGGTGATTTAAAKTNLGLVVGTDIQAFDADLTDLADGSLSGSKIGTGIDAANITTNSLAIANGGTGAATAAAARTNLGLGSISTLGAITTTEISDGTIMNVDINAAAGIVDTKLATISTAGKVSGGAITSGTIGGSTAFNTSGAVTSTVSSGSAISGSSASTSGGAGLYGINTSSSTAAVGIYGYTPNLNGTGAKAIWGYSPGGIGVEGQTDSGYGLYGISNTGTAVYGESYGSYSGYFYNGTTAGGMGLYSAATATGTSSGTKYGLYSLAWYGLGSNYGVYGYGYGGTNAYGVYGFASGGSVTNYAGYFAGQVYINGTVYGSDRKIKKDIQPLTGGLDLIMRLKPSTYYFRNDGEFKKMNHSTQLQYGLIAQDVEEVLPSIVSEVVQPADKDPKSNETSPEMRFKGLNYTELIPILIKAVQEQQDQINALKAEIEILKKK